MKTLLIARHAKSDWGNPSLPDHDRPLNARGRRDAPKVARAVAAAGCVLERVYSSTSARTRETWARMRPELTRLGALGPRPLVEWRRDLYLASAADVQAVVRAAPADADAIMVLGHNPAVHQVAARLSVRGEPALLERVARHMPTGAVAVVELDAPRWDAAASGGMLARLILPRDLE